MQKEWSRRRLLQTLGLATLGTSLGGELWGRPVTRTRELSWQPTLNPPPAKKITAIVLGAGNRGNVYGNYAYTYPDQLDIVGVAEPIPIRQSRFGEKHAIPAERRYVTWEHVFEHPKFADAVIITTPDDLHYGPAMAALAMGYDLLLEKPIAQTWQECKDILDLATEKDRIVAVCHVLRYSPYYRKMKAVIDSGILGELVSIQHLEPIEHIHMSHSYVRGNWGRSDKTNPILLAKSCHDLDILRWWIGKPCERVSSFGSLKWFREENAPAGSTARCTDGCAAEANCPYSAKRIYYDRRQRLYVFDLPEDEPARGEAILKELREGPYGRCVYRCDNDQPDHQIVSLQFAEGITANFSMEAFTHYAGRRTRIMGSLGDVVGDETDMLVTDFRTGEQERWNVHENAELSSGHGGGDWGLVRDWLRAVDQQDASLLTSTLAASMESHLMGFQAEKSRRDRTVEDIIMD
ncbi:MAG: Gfo/Idh/MocA family oxidoreductase [Lewinella sp.]|nr:Gfo/Idh/MocA family oxidoreductase [Lewinella sp.]